MLRFENGEFAGGDFKKVFNPETVDDITFNMYDEHLLESCWILYIKDYDEPIEVFSIVKKDIKSIPRHFEDDMEAHNYFWESNETLLFQSLEDILEFMECYCDDGSEELTNILQELRERKILSKAISEYECLFGIAENSDADLFREITDLISSKGMNRENVYATLKEILLHQYFIEHKEIEEMKKVA